MKKIALKFIGFLLWSPVATAQVYYFHLDHLDSTVLVSNGVGEILQLENYTPFGEISHEIRFTKDASRFQYTGQEFDSSIELHYYGARYYDSVTARFVSADPILMNLPYSYALNNPLRYVDPTGLDEEESGIEPTPEPWYKKLRRTVEEKLGPVTLPELGGSGFPTVPNSWGGGYNTTLPGPVLEKPDVERIMGEVERRMPPYYGAGAEVATKETIGNALGALMKMSFQVAPHSVYPVGSLEVEGSEGDREVTLIYDRFRSSGNRQLRTDIFNYLAQKNLEEGVSPDPFFSEYDPLGANNRQEFQAKFTRLAKSLHEDIGRYRDNPAGLQGDVQARSALSIAERLAKLTELTEGG